MSEPELKISKSKSDQKLQRSEIGEKLLRNLESETKASPKKKLSLYDALRSRADMVKSDSNAVSKSAALLKSAGKFPTDKAEEIKSVGSGQFEEGLLVFGNSLEDFPVSFHPEEELARKG